MTFGSKPVLHLGGGHPIVIGAAAVRVPGGVPNTAAGRAQGGRQRYDRRHRPRPCAVVERCGCKLFSS